MCGRATSTISSINHVDFRTLHDLDGFDRLDRLDSGVGDFTIVGVYHVFIPATLACASTSLCSSVGLHLFILLCLP